MKPGDNSGDSTAASDLERAVDRWLRAGQQTSPGTHVIQSISRSISRTGRAAGARLKPVVNMFAPTPGRPGF